MTSFIETISKLDQQLFLFLNGLHVSWLDAPMFWTSHRYTWLPLYAWLIFLLWKRANKIVFGLQLAAIGLSLVLCDRISSGLVKPFFARLRPCHEPALQSLIHSLEDCAGKFGFVSSHAANTFGAAMFFWLIWHKKWPIVRWLFVWATLVSYSRIYVGKHYPADVVFGGILGVACAWLAYQIMLKVQQKYFSVGSVLEQ